MSYSGMPTDTSVAFMERTMQMKIHVRQSFFVGEGKWSDSVINTSVKQFRSVENSRIKHIFGESENVL